MLSLYLFYLMCCSSCYHH